MKEILVPVVGMGCDYCVTKINKAVSRLAGVDRLEVNLANAQMQIGFDEAQVGLTHIRGAVQGAGYDLDLRSFDANASAPKPEHDCSERIRP